jgi:uroporphyrinogen-III synthase
VSGHAAALRGVRVAVTRPDEGGDALSLELESRGAVPLTVPLLAIAPVEDDSDLRRAALSLDTYDWVVFTSANGARYLAAAMAAAGAAAGARPARVAVVGDATAHAVADLLGWGADVTPGHFTGDALPEAMRAAGPLHGTRVLWPRALGARDALPRGLAAAGAVLDSPPAYRTIELPDNARKLAGLLERREVDVVTLTSPSAARCLAAARPRTDAAVFAVIGPVTADTARACGLPVHVAPLRHTFPALVEALAAHLSRMPR